LKLAPFQTRSPLPFAALPISLIPSARFTDKTDEEMIHEQLSGKIIGAAMDVPLSCRAGNVTLHPVIAAKLPFCEPALSERSESNGRHL
jgi:hypothetical protein